MSIARYRWSYLLQLFCDCLNFPLDQDSMRSFFCRFICLQLLWLIAALLCSQKFYSSIHYTTHSDCLQENSPVWQKYHWNNRSQNFFLEILLLYLLLPLRKANCPLTQTNWLALWRFWWQINRKQFLLPGKSNGARNLPYWSIVFFTHDFYTAPSFRLCEYVRARSAKPKACVKQLSARADVTSLEQ